MRLRMRSRKHRSGWGKIHVSLTMSDVMHDLGAGR